jgi:hypothetical protein
MNSAINAFIRFTVERRSSESPAVQRILLLSLPVSESVKNF